MKEIKRPYIAGPMTGYPDWNMPAFDRAEQHLIDLGLHPINPADHFNRRTDLPWHVYIAHDIRVLVKESDSVIFLDGWERSRGAQIEYLIARGLGLPVFRFKSFVVKEITYFPPTASFFLEEMVKKANELVLGPRRADYGHPLDDFTKTVKMWQHALPFPWDFNLPPEDFCLAMICVKISRQMNAYKKDNLIDIAGYAACYRLVMEEKARRAAPPSESVDNPLLSENEDTLPEWLGLIEV